jgi:hypothetical protein
MGRRRRQIQTPHDRWVEDQAADRDADAKLKKQMMICSNSRRADHSSKLTCRMLLPQGLDIRFTCAGSEAYLA